MNSKLSATKVEVSLRSVPACSLALGWGEQIVVSRNTRDLGVGDVGFYWVI